jgi:uncharacterized protein YcfJ
MMRNEIIMKKTYVAAAALMVSISTANAAETFVDVPVISSTPIQQTSEIRTPVQNCSEQLVRVDNNGNLLPTLFGAAIGGFMGSQIGGGNGRFAATALGTLFGAGVGQQNWGKKLEPKYHRRNVCTTSYNISHQTTTVGYMVTYTFEGQTYTTRMQTAPSNKIRLMLNTTHTVK